MVESSKWEAAQLRIEGNAFHVLKHKDDLSATWAELVSAFASDVAVTCRMREGSINKTLIRDPNARVGNLEWFLGEILKRACEHAAALTCVIEADHVDSVYRDLYSSVYSHEFFDADRRAIRISIFADELNERAFFIRPGRREHWDLTPVREGSGPSLQDIFVGCVVAIPRCGGIVGRTLLDPRWLVNEPLAIRLSDYDITVRGKRVSVQAFPFRGQDGEAMSCGETTIMSLLCYFSNEYGEYPITMPTEVLRTLSDAPSGRMLPSRGLDYEEVGKALAHAGLFPRSYHSDHMTVGVVPGEDATADSLMRKVAWTYVSSGIPVAVNVQSIVGRGLGVGHSLVLVGLGDESIEHVSLAKNEAAERITTPSGNPIRLIDAADLDVRRRFVVVDDTQVPYACRSWEELSAFRMMVPVELLVPTARGMSLDAMDARDIAGEILRSPKVGLSQGSGGLLDGSDLVLTQRMVSVRSYLRQRVSTCDERIAYVWEGSSFPRWAWLFECVSLSQWSKPAWERKAVSELLLDATSVTPGDPTSRVVLLRYPGFLHYHAPAGDGIVDTGDVPQEFVSYDCSLRHVGFEADSDAQSIGTEKECS